MYAAATHDLGAKSRIEAKLWAINEDLRVCIEQDWLPVILEIDSLVAYNCLWGFRSEEDTNTARCTIGIRCSNHENTK